MIFLVQILYYKDIIDRYCQTLSVGSTLLCSLDTSCSLFSNPQKIKDMSEPLILLSRNPCTTYLLREWWLSLFLFNRHFCNTCYMPGAVLKYYTNINSFNSHSNLMKLVLWLFHFTDEESESWRRDLTCLSCSVKLDFQPRYSDSKSFTHNHHFVLNFSPPDIHHLYLKEKNHLVLTFLPYVGVRLYNGIPYLFKPSLQYSLTTSFYLYWKYPDYVFSSSLYA